MHNNYNIYYFINNFNSEEIKKLDKRISIIFRNYKNSLDLNLVKKIRDNCISHKRKFFLANNLKVAKNLGLDGVYIPSFNNLQNFKNLNIHKEFKIIGSAHDKAQLINKENQGCTEVFISPVFKNKKSNFFLGVVRFNLISNFARIKVVALGGINASNLRLLRSTKFSGYAAISWIKKTGLRNIRPVFKF